jgi:hypothetical protein
VLHVAFQNSQHEAAWEPGEQFESQYLVVTSRDGGATFSAPVHVVNQEDGSRDFPLNVDGRQTLTGLQVRVPTGGTMAVDPSSGRAYITFTDNRAGIHDVAEPVTNAKAYIVTSADGVSWSASVAVDTSDTESWFPWVDVAPRWDRWSHLQRSAARQHLCRGAGRGCPWSVRNPDGEPGAVPPGRVPVLPGRRPGLRGLRHLP